jgi:hypothetical protein
VKRDQKVVIFGIRARVSKTLETPSFASFKTLAIVFSFFVFFKANYKRPDREVVGNPKSSLMAELVDKVFACTFRKPSFLLVYLLTF